MDLAKAPTRLGPNKKIIMITTTNISNIPNRPII